MTLILARALGVSMTELVERGSGVLMRVAAAALTVFGAILLFIGLRAALRASRYEMAERWFRYGLWATGVGIALQAVGVLIAVGLR